VTLSPVLPRVRYSRGGIFSVFAKEETGFNTGETAIPKSVDEIRFMNFRRPIFSEDIEPSKK
jgi:hypothetical protein